MLLANQDDETIFPRPTRPQSEQRPDHRNGLCQSNPEFNRGFGPSGPVGQSSCLKVKEWPFTHFTERLFHQIRYISRPSNHDRWLSKHRLRKSRSETGGSMERGLWPSESSNQSSPMGAASTASSGFGSRIVGIGNKTLDRVPTVAFFPQFAFMTI